MTRARIAVIGTGWWSAQFHLPALLAEPRAEVVALVDTNPQKLALAAETFGVHRTYASTTELLTAGGVDGVVIAVPHRWHFEAAYAALEAGVHVLVEKPMVLDTDEAWRLVDLAADRRLHLVVGYTFHFTRHTRAARDLVASGRLGEIRLVSGLYSSVVESFLRGVPADGAEELRFPPTGPDPSTYSDPVIAGGGQGQTQVTHAMANMLHVTGLRAASVTAHMRSFGLRVDLADAISYELAGGAIGTMASVGSVRPGQPTQQEFRYYGSDGLLLQDLAGGRLAAWFNDGTSQTWGDLTEQEMYPAHATAGCLVDLICGGTHNPAPGELGARTVEFLAAAYRSAASGGVPVPVATGGGPVS